jgi:hypothetical protein
MVHKRRTEGKVWKNWTSRQRLTVPCDLKLITIYYRFMAYRQAAIECSAVKTNRPDLGFEHLLQKPRR